jgi:nucleoside-diphosphate-sugar epimerase
MIQDSKILVTGATSQVGWPVVQALAPHNEVLGLARFQKSEDRERFEAIGARPIAGDFATDALDEVPGDLDIVLHFAVAKSGDFEQDLAANAEGLGRLISRCRRVNRLLHCSSGGVYAPPGHKPASEGDPLGDSHHAMLPTYSLSKIAAESMARFCAQEWEIPTTIARLSVPYGANGGWPWFHLVMMQKGVPIPVHPDAPNVFNPIHEDDYIAQIPKLLDVATVPATTVNWGGEPVSIEDWCAYLGELTGLKPKFRETEETIPSLPLDLTRMHELIGPTSVGWRDGIRRMAEARNPELLRSPTS